MTAPIWRWLVVALVAANLLILLARLLQPAAVETGPQELPALDPSLARLERVMETGGSAEATLAEVCYSIGPLPTQLARDRAEDRLRPFASLIRSRQTEADNDRGWWVYLPAASRLEATGLSRELAERGVEDYFVVTGGALENSVSVGLFENIDNARRRQASLRALGFDAQLEVRREIIPQFWVDYRIMPDERSPWRFILRASPGAQHRDPVLG